MVKRAVITRYIFTMAEAASALLGDEEGDAEAFVVAVNGDVVTLDVVNPARQEYEDDETDAEAEAPESDTAEVGAAQEDKTQDGDSSDGDEVPWYQEDQSEDGDRQDDGGEQDETSKPEDEERTVDRSKKSGGVDQNGEEAQRKGGKLAQRAGILCNEGGFRVFADASDAQGAADYIREVCGVQSRADLDHDEEAGRKFLEMDSEYRSWLRDG